MEDIPTGLSYGDALVIPRRSPVDSRSAVDLSTTVAPGVDLDRPVLSAAMDTVTERETATALARAGGLGVVHRFCSVDRQAREVRAVADVDAGGPVAAAVGVAGDYGRRADRLVEAGADLLVVDVAHGHTERCLSAVRELADRPVPLAAGNVATPEGVADLARAGADCVKVGVGPGSHCTTREVAGAGYPQLSAVDRCSDRAADLDVRTVADGGVRNSGDAVKALVAGADAVMVGRLLAGTDEAPGEVVERDGERYKRSRGMATAAANEDRPDGDPPAADEGVEALTPCAGPLSEVVEELAAGVRSGLSYCGAPDLPTARERGRFVRVAPGARQFEGAHGVADR